MNEKESQDRYRYVTSYYRRQAADRARKRANERVEEGGPRGAKTFADFERNEAIRDTCRRGKRGRMGGSLFDGPLDA
jgi:hypothetical protein